MWFELRYWGLLIGQGIIWVTCIPFVLWHLWLASLADKRQVARDRMMIMELRQQADYGSDYREWKRCDLGCFEKTSALFCVKHKTPVRFEPVTMLQKVRVLNVLASDAIQQRLPVSEQEQMGSFFLTLEEQSGSYWDSVQTLALYNVQRHSQTVEASNE